MYWEKVIQVLSKGTQSNNNNCLCHACVRMMTLTGLLGPFLRCASSSSEDASSLSDMS
jgi:hypothetical protein